MATHRLTSFITIRQAGNFCGVSMHWEIVDPTIVDAYPLAMNLVEALDTPVAGDSYWGKFIFLLASDSFVKTVRIRQVSPPNANNAVRFFQDDDFPGSFAGDTDALNVAGCIIFLTAGDAGLTGRQFIPAVSEEAYENGRATATYINVINDYIDLLLAGVQGTAGTFFPVVKHGTPAVYTRITNGYLSATPGTQKRRRVPW